MKYLIHLLLLYNINTGSAIQKTKAPAFKRNQKRPQTKPPFINYNRSKYNTELYWWVGGMKQPPGLVDISSLSFRFHQHRFPQGLQFLVQAPCRVPTLRRIQHSKHSHQTAPAILRLRQSNTSTAFTVGGLRRRRRRRRRGCEGG